MARKKNTEGEMKTSDYRHKSETRKNIPPAKIASEGQVPQVQKAKYYYSPHLSAKYRFDETGETDKLLNLRNKMVKALTEEEVNLLDSTIASHQPWLEWANKREQELNRFFEVDPVALHIHERISTQAILSIAKREDPQRDLFANSSLPYHEQVKFYCHDIDWTNRLILGDSLQVMSSLSKRESLAGKVQMVYMDPPYGVKYRSNFQPEILSSKVGERPEDLPREAETVKAYRDTWKLGVHSYLTYLKDRFHVAHDLLTETGSIFVQISDENLHRVTCLLDEVFGAENKIAVIPFRKKTMPLGTNFAEQMDDFIIWYAKRKYYSSGKPCAKYNPLFLEKTDEPDSNYKYVEDSSFVRRPLTTAEKKSGAITDSNLRLYRLKSLEPSGPMASGRFRPEFEGQTYDFPSNGYSVNPDGMRRLLESNRVQAQGNLLNYVLFIDDNRATSMTIPWNDTAGASEKLFAVQTDEEVIKRCMLMTTSPGDLVLDPTSGSGSTAKVAEQWGRRWIAIDTSRVAISIARQRLLTARMPFYSIVDPEKGVASGFRHKTLPHITVKSISQNSNLDSIISKHNLVLDQKLDSLNTIWGKLDKNLKQNVIKAVSNTAARTSNEISSSQLKSLSHYEVPSSASNDWPEELQFAILSYRKAWREKIEEINKAIESNAEPEYLLDKPEISKGILRVSGPFTVEGIHPLENSGVAHSKEVLDTGDNNDKNVHAYLSRMVSLIRKDGITFPNNKHRGLSRIEPLHEAALGSGLHADAIWEGMDETKPNSVAIAFGPQYGPVTAQQVEDLVRGSRRYDELIIAGFSFDAEAAEVIQESQHPKLKIHMAHIRPDVSPGMDGLLKDTPNSQLFTVFGQPEIKVHKKSGEIQVELVGVDIYDPLKGEVKSCGAEKVAAWFLDVDYDGRCFCITQAFFPDQDAWGKIAKSLGSSADLEVFEAFKGTISVPFKPGENSRVAVKVIDPRGNEVMAVAKL